MGGREINIYIWSMEYGEVVGRRVGRRMTNGGQFVYKVREGVDGKVLWAHWAVGGVIDWIIDPGKLVCGVLTRGSHNDQPGARTPRLHHYGDFPPMKQHKMEWGK